MRHAPCSLAAAALTAALAAAVLAWPAGPVHANGTVSIFEHHPDVRVFAPAPLAHGTVDSDPAPVQPVHVTVHVQFDALALDWRYRRALYLAHRADLIHRTIGHRYTGFIKMYHGPRYPF